LPNNIGEVKMKQYIRSLILVLMLVSTMVVSATIYTPKWVDGDVLHLVSDVGDEITYDLVSDAGADDNGNAIDIQRAGFSGAHPTISNGYFNQKFATMKRCILMMRIRGTKVYGTQLDIEIDKPFKVSGTFSGSAIGRVGVQSGILDTMLRMKHNFSCEFVSTGTQGSFFLGRFDKAREYTYTPKE
jgi:hypothetical protein